MSKHAHVARTLVSCAFCFSVACEPQEQRPEPRPTDPSKPPPTMTPSSDPDAPQGDRIVPPLPPDDAPPESARKSVELPNDFHKRVTSWFERHGRRRLYVQVDKPLYKPGETIWIRSWDLATRDLGGEGAAGTVKYELVSPKGAVVLEKLVESKAGHATNDFELPAAASGGEYTIRVAAGGETAERPIIVSTYEAPRIKKKLEFLRKAYGPGDEVKATLDIRRPTGAPLGKHPVVAVARLDGVELPRTKTTTNDDGGAVVRMRLPDDIRLGDGLLTVLVEDGGVTESISKRIPIVLKKMQLSFFPEGGKMIGGLPTRLYFEAKNTLGKPADVEGELVDDTGQVAARFASHWGGLGRVDFTPGTGRRYTARITRPAGVIEKYALPLAEESGCNLMAYDDLDGALEVLRVAVRCDEARDVVVAGVRRERLFDSAMVSVKEGEPAVVYLKDKDQPRAQGVARVTVFDDKLRPLAERIVFTHRRTQLDVAVAPHKERYAPRDQVTLTLTTKAPGGEGVPSEVALSVVDDTVLSFADDKTAHMLAAALLAPEIPGDVEEPNFFFDLKEDKSALAMDLLMGTRGWRTFEWHAALAPPPPPMPARAPGEMFEGLLGGAGADAEMPAAMAPAEAFDEAMPADMPKVAAMPDEKVAAPMADEAPPRPAEPVMAEPAAPPPPPLEENEQKPMGAKKRMAAQNIAKDEEFDRAMAKEMVAPERRQAMQIAPVRVFPAPVYGGSDVSGARTDFRETIHWAPFVKTGKDGTATVTFYLSDAVTSFRVLAEGAGGGFIGRSEEVIESSLPFSMSVKLPVEVSAGDEIWAPLTLTNDRADPLDARLTSSFGELVQLTKPVDRASTILNANTRESLLFPLAVTGVQGKSKVRFAASASGLEDAFERDLVVVPAGFPTLFEASGKTSTKQEKHLVDARSAIPGSIDARVTFVPSTSATLLSGLDGLLRQPSGCFEQTSSSNYPNVMIMSYLTRNDIAAPDVAARSSKLIEDGYQRLVGFESPQKGYEWFGGDPGHEALTAYGVLEFIDMKAVYPDVDDGMIARTTRWLLSRRDGKGGYLRNDRALDSFGAASPDVTNAYITYALATAKVAGLEKEIDARAAAATAEDDAYLLALDANTLVAAGKLDAARAAAKRLVALQDADGAWKKADHSVTRSGGENLYIETTALAVTALLDVKGHDVAVKRAVDWLTSHRGGYGQWGATQATVLALKALVRHAEASAKLDSPGSVVVMVNGKLAKKVDYEAGHAEPIVVRDLGALLAAGQENEVKILHDGKGELPYTLAVEMYQQRPASSPEVAVDVRVVLDKAEVKMGETVRATAKLSNKHGDRGLPMTLVRVGIPGGLSFQTWQLKELREKGDIAFFETRPREVILYFRDLAPGAQKTIPLDLVATVPGKYTGPASSAYLYYTDEHKAWAPPLAVEIAP